MKFASIILLLFFVLPAKAQTPAQVRDSNYRAILRQKKLEMGVDTSRFHYGMMMELYPNRLGVNLGFGFLSGYDKNLDKVLKYMNNLHMVGQRSIQGQTYVGLNQGFFFGNNNLGSTISSTQIQLSVAVKFIYGGIRLGYLNNSVTNQWDFISELGVGWKYAFLKYQWNHYFDYNPMVLPRRNFALQVFIPISKH